MKTWTPTSMHHVNLNHPNWTASAFRTAREAFGVGLEWPGYDNDARPSGWDVAAVVIGIGVLVGFLFIGPEVFA